MVKEKNTAEQEHSMSSSSSNATPSTTPALENTKIEQMLAGVKKEQDHYLQRLIAKETSRLREEFLAVQYLCKSFFPEAPLPDRSEKPTPVMFEIVPSSTHITDDSAVFSTTGQECYSFVTPWSSGGKNGFFRTILGFRHSPVLEEDEVETPYYHFETPVFINSEETVDRPDRIAFRPENRPEKLDRVYRDVYGCVQDLEDSPRDDYITSLMHVGEVPWKVTQSKVEDGYVGVHFQNLHDPSHVERYIQRESKTFFPCCLGGVFYYVVAGKRNTASIVSFADSEVVHTFYLGGKPRAVVTCDRYFVIIIDSVDDGLMKAFSVAIAPY